MTTIRVSANFSSQGTADEPQFLIARAELATLDAAKEFAASFKGTGMNGVALNDHGRVLGVAKLTVALTSNGVNGGRNEAGIRRYRKLLKLAAARGIAIEWVADFKNSYRTQSEFEAAIT